jgi:hypothetical protein
MKSISMLAFFLMVLAGFTSLSLSGGPFNTDSKIIVTDKDKAILQQKIDKFLPDRNLPIGELMIKIGKDFIGTPYVAKTLDQNSGEPLVINLRELDCTTFVENCFAIARTIKSSKPNFKQFTEELENIRYRDGKRNGYTSRLHYFSEWISNNENKRLIDDVTFQLGGKPYPIKLNIMSTKPELYPQLKNNPELIEKIRLTETELSKIIFFYIPTVKFPDCENEIIDGDIAALTASVEGIDILHVGFMFQNKGHVYFLHASQTEKKVVMTESPFIEYLKGRKGASGVMIARPTTSK